MNMEKNTNFGSINITEEAIANLAGDMITECYGVVGMASKQILKDGWSELLKKENSSKGVVIRKTDAGIEVDLYVIVLFGIKISEVVQEAQKKMKYTLEKSLSQELAAVNIFVQGVQVNKE